MNQHQWHPNLIRALAVCLQDTFVGGFYADKVIERTFKKNRQWGSRDRRFIAETVYDMVRWWSLLARYDEGPFAPVHEVGYIRRWITYEAWHNKRDVVEFVNNHLPKELTVAPNFPLLLRERFQKTELTPWEKVAFPQWLYEKIMKAFPEEGQKILEGLNQPAPVWVRVNTLKTDRETLIKRLAEEDVQLVPSETLPHGAMLKIRKNVFTTKAFKEGLFEVQDGASQMIAPLLNPKAGERIADVCAGAGGKTLHLAALMGNKGSLLGADVSERKLEELKLRARRAGVSNLRIQLFENSKDVKRHAENFDGVLIDAPCTGTGVIRRNSDTKWKLKPEELDRLKEIQREVLTDYSRMVRPGGRLIYATCSVLPEEGCEQVDWFLSQNPHFERAGEALQTFPHRDSQDGFFAQKLIRKTGN